jgi:hypothetical protein
LGCCVDCGVISWEKKKRKRRRSICKMKEQVLKIFVTVSSEGVYCKEMRIKKE